MTSMLGKFKSFASKFISHERRQAWKRSLFSVQDMHMRLLNLKNAGLRPEAAIDGGSYHGDWAREFWRIWPTTPLLLVEPQPECGDMLHQLARQVPGSRVAPCALGAECGTVTFRMQESNSGVEVPQKGDSDTDGCHVPMKTLDALTCEWKEVHPNFLKLDLQGYELEALRGGVNMLAAVELILLEVSVLRIGDVPIFREVDRHMESIGFRLYDALPQYYRPRDGALWQMDVFYIRETSPLIASRSWD